MCTDTASRGPEVNIVISAANASLRPFVNPMRGARFENYEERTNRRLAERLEHDDKQAQAQQHERPTNELSAPSGAPPIGDGDSLPPLQAHEPESAVPFPTCGLAGATSTERRIICSVHGDDFTPSGPEPTLDWLETAIQQKHDITIGSRLGPGPQAAKEARVLNRVVRWEQNSVSYRADPRQIERLIEGCGLDGGKLMSTLSVKAMRQETNGGSELPEHLHTAFRAAAARGN